VSGIALLGLYAGGTTILEPEGLPSGIIKQPITETRQIGKEGLQGDVQADRKVHGGPEKALHHYAAENYAELQQQFPLVADKLLPGSIGENISTQGLTEAEACIGDIYRLGTALIQINQPRRPCWKIDSRYGQEGITRFVELAGCTGWYYRVLENGEVSPGSGMELQARPHPDWSVLALNDLGQELRPDLARLAAAAELPALNADWQVRLNKRLAWLRENT